MEEFKSTLSRRQFVTLMGTTTAGLAMLSMTGCGGGGGDAAAPAGGSAPAGEPVKGGTFKVALNRTISAKSLDPLYVDSTTADQVCQNYGDTLVQENFDQSEYLPCIATKWEISEDGKVYTFTIRDDVHFQPGKFQDGRLLTAEDVAYSINRAKEMGDLRRRQGLHLHHPRRRSLPARQVPGRPSADRRGRRVLHQPR